MRKFTVILLVAALVLGAAAAFAAEPAPTAAIGDGLGENPAGTALTSDVTCPTTIIIIFIILIILALPVGFALGVLLCLLCRRRCGCGCG